ncbi:reductase [Microbacterium esteraromaticum]|uniref:NAD-dependent epimerase/dehydratase family protein n=1 Tax=Microbacterium esteraromaticum TaxID=57043 RepID=UPI002367DE2E|nr:NAD-dependent epimerase/dehydratase family protein [Microbacterium esteraromaticum]WDH77837.1 reductase [Microbacterium esteraromaticum]
MTQVLVLGGTGWLSGRIAQRWRDAGAQVTCLARGSRPAPDGTVLLRGDRDEPDVYDRLREQQWDEIVDISSRADHVGAAVAALGDSAAHWTYVSSVSVYADEVTVGLDETGPLHAPAQPGDEYDYSAQKVAAEQAVTALGTRAGIVRPGLVVGAGDPSDRFGYWAAAFARAGDGAVLAPDSRDRFAQVIDVDDLAGFITADRRTGVVNAIGDPLPLSDLLDAFRTESGHTGPVRVADDDWLGAHGVQYWMGERSLPLWLPADMPGFAQHDNRAYRAAGGGFTPLDQTIRSVLADERARGLDRERRAGLTRHDESELLAQLV